MPVTDKFTKVSDGGRAEPTTLALSRSVAAATITCDDLTTWADGEAVHFIIYTVDNDGKKVVGSQIDCKGVVSGNTLTNVQYKAGNDVGNTIGAIVQASPTAAWADDLSAGLLQEHKRDGTHDAITATSVATTGRVTAGNGLTVSTGTVVLPAASIEKAELEKPHYGKVYLSTGGPGGGYVLPAYIEYNFPFDAADPNNFGVTVNGNSLITARDGIYNITIQMTMSDGSPAAEFLTWLWIKYPDQTTVQRQRIRHMTRPISTGNTQTYTHTMWLQAGTTVTADVWCAPNNIRLASFTGTSDRERRDHGPYIAIYEIR
jgi:hypothetical protein